MLARSLDRTAGTASQGIIPLSRTTVAKEHVGTFVMRNTIGNVKAPAVITFYTTADWTGAASPFTVPVGNYSGFILEGILNGYATTAGVQSTFKYNGNTLRFEVTMIGVNSFTVNPLLGDISGIHNLQHVVGVTTFGTSNIITDPYILMASPEFQVTSSSTGKKVIMISTAEPYGSTMIVPVKVMLNSTSRFSYDFYDHQFNKLTVTDWVLYLE